MIKHKKLSLLFAVGGALAAAAAVADTTGNRYGYPVLYHSEISAAEAWLLASTEGKSREDKFKWHRHQRQPKPVILDVRRVEEYVAGHPPGAYSIPFPHVTKSPATADDDGSSSGYIGYNISVDPEVGFLAADGKDGTLAVEDFVQAVESAIPDKDTPIFIVCATGHRSVQAANALAKYGHYTQVRNVWEGYNGQPKYAYEGDKPKQVPSADDPSVLEFVQLDLNNDGVLDGQDRDGWAYFQGLPTETKLKRKLLDRRYLRLYYGK